MKETPTPAAFSFTKHLIRKFAFFEPYQEQGNISIDFEPSGEYDEGKGVYKLILRFFATYGEKNDQYLIDLIVEGIFQFSEKTSKEEIPDYFYPNSIAILYPYLRAFVTTTTSVANTKTLILPTLNLSSLANPLKANTALVNID